MASNTPPLENASPSHSGDTEMDDSYVNFTLEEFTTFNLEPTAEKDHISEDGLREEIKKVEPLHPEEVRWFYLKNGSKNSKLKPMCGNDSLRVENAYRKFIEGFKTYKKKITIRGGLFEVDFDLMACFPIYWSSCDEGEAVLRGTWFYDNWFPLSLENSEVIEREHQARWKGYDITLIKELMDHDVMHSVKLKECHVEWKSVTNVMLYKDNTVNRAIRNVGQRIGVSKATTSGYQIHRGYSTYADKNDDLPPVENLMLVVHGIGARADCKRVVRNTNDFRGLCRKFESELDTKTRSVYIPVEWRSRLKLNEDLIKSITPHKSITIRRYIHHTALDIMYYTSPLYHMELVNSLRKELNRVYKMFIERNPDFNGRVNIFAHSLGNIIFHDVCTNWRPDYLNEAAFPEKQDLPTSNVKTSFAVDGVQRSTVTNDDELAFKPHTLFCLGSPLGIFFSLRGFVPDGSSAKILPPSCKRMYNIYHPADPFAYRLEPLIYEHYRHVKPVEVRSSKSEKSSKTPTRTGQVDAISPRGFSRQLAQHAKKEIEKKNQVDAGNVSKDATSSSKNSKKLLKVNSDSPLGAVDEPAVNHHAGEGPTDESSIDESDYSGKHSYFKIKNYKNFGRSMAGGAVRLGTRLFSRSGSDEQTATANTSSTTNTPAATSTESTDYVLNAQPPDMEECELDPQVQPVLPRRVDYALQEGFTESRFGYAALTSHTSYWRNPDLARFITTVLQKSDDEAAVEEEGHHVTSESADATETEPSLDDDSLNNAADDPSDDSTLSSSITSDASTAAVS